MQIMTKTEYSPYSYRLMAFILNIVIMSLTDKNMLF